MSSRLESLSGEAEMDPDLKPELIECLLAMADDEIVLSHRDSEWCGHAPILEEDIAFANIALDEMGHAITWYRLLSELSGENPDTYPDRLVFLREATAFRSAQMVELPKGDWAFTIVRQYLFDAAEAVRLPHQARSAYRPLAEAAGKVLQEERYHLRHTSAWLRRLGLGTEESHRRMQLALEELWPFAMRMMETPSPDGGLADAGILPSTSSVAAEWRERVSADLVGAGLDAPQELTRTVGARRDHSEFLRDLLTDMQSVARAHPGEDW